MMNASTVPHAIIRLLQGAEEMGGQRQADLGQEGYYKVGESDC